MRILANRLLAMFLIVVVIGALGYLASHYGSLEWLIENENRMRAFVVDYPVQGWTLGFVIYTLFSLVPGTAGKSVVWGWVFGFWPAVLMVDLGLTLAAIASFLIGRFLVRGVVEKKLGHLIERLDRLARRDAAFYLLMTRVAHVPFSLVNYGASSTSIRLSTFSWTTLVGLLPGTMIFVFVGTRIPTLSTIAEQGVWKLLDPLLISLLVVTFVFPLLVRFSMGRLGKRSGTNGLNDSEIETLRELTVKGHS